MFQKSLKKKSLSLPVKVLLSCYFIVTVKGFPVFMSKHFQPMNLSEKKPRPYQNESPLCFKVSKSYSIRQKPNFRLVRSSFRQKS